MKHIIVIHLSMFLFFIPVNAQIRVNPDENMIAGHKAVYDADGNILSWYLPEVPGAGYAQVMKLASGFIKSGTPSDPDTGLKIYYLSCCFQGPHMTGQADFENGKTWEQWPNNPACVFAGLVKSLVIGYRVFSGDPDYISIVRNMLDYMLENGTTPGEWPWARVPFASSDPGKRQYRGAAEWENDGMRGDGLNGIEPDKVAELGNGYLLFYEVTENTKYLHAALDCARALATHIRDVRPAHKPFALSDVRKSPWPFRVNAKTDSVISEYCSNVIEPIRLFDELIRISDRTGFDVVTVNKFKETRHIALDWLFSINGPMKTYIWNGYFEDVPNDPDRANRLQITPLETARYFLEKTETDPDINHDVPALLNWVESVFATPGMDAIREQTWCFEPMGSHTARFASVCALWYEHSHDMHYRDKAYRYFNLATYMTDANGVVRVGPDWPGSWFSDGYGDYIRHFYEGISAVPEWSPAGENHLLRSSSVIQRISYDKYKIHFRTYDENSVELLSVNHLPLSVMVNGNVIVKDNTASQYWNSEELDNGNFLITISHRSGREIEINFKD